MCPDTPSIRAIQFSKRVKGIGLLAVWANAFPAFAVLLFDFQSGGHGEMGSFYRHYLIRILLFTGWGIATGIGLVRAWRWARFSALIFSGFLAAGGGVALVAFLRLPGSWFFDWKILLARLAIGSFTVIPIVVGTRWLILFRRPEVKAYFQGFAAPR